MILRLFCRLRLFPRLRLFCRLRRFRRHPGSTIRALYGAIVAQARKPAFYAAYGVPDTVEGRFADGENPPAGARRLASYVRSTIDLLAAQDGAAFAGARLRFPDPDIIGAQS